MSRSCWRSFEKVLLAAILFSDESPMIHWKLAEGVGFEPTVGCPTLDFESSALNRTQPPFLVERRKRRTSNIECNCLRDSAFSVGRWNLSVVFSPSSGLPDRLVDRIRCSRSKKMLQLKACHVWQAYCILYVHTDSHAITCC